ncbi:MAG TPA: diaminopimelate epimerase [Pyrinomonadaceae bacterium]|jgi:diaminopimelate epimerase
MNTINFCKFHGFGNDYIVVENAELQTVSDLSEFTREICHRNTGVGGDGIVVLEKLVGETADYGCRIINPDGSEAGFSGNGTRCAVAYLYYKNLFSAENLKLKTKSGVKNYQLLKREKNTFWFTAELGKPKFDLPGNRAKDLPEQFQGLPVTTNIMLPGLGIVVKDFFFVDVGNPVTGVFVEDFNEHDWRLIGQTLENLTSMFPEKTNVVFIKIIDEKNIEIRIWERGAGETASSGTCSIAAAVASAYKNKTGREVSVHAPGGTTEAVWREDGEMLITGRADLAFCGEYTSVKSEYKN